MEMIEAGKVSWKYMLGVIAVVTKAALAAAGVHLVTGCGSIGDGLGIINSHCQNKLN